jgi:hypothetical protein
MWYIDINIGNPEKTVGEFYEGSQRVFFGKIHFFAYYWNVYFGITLLFKNKNPLLTNSSKNWRKKSKFSPEIKYERTDWGFLNSTKFFTPSMDAQLWQIINQFLLFFISLFVFLRHPCEFRPKS